MNQSIRSLLYVVGSDLAESRSESTEQSVRRIESEMERNADRVDWLLRNARSPLHAVHEWLGPDGPPVRVMFVVTDQRGTHQQRDTILKVPLLGTYVGLLQRYHQSRLRWQSGDLIAISDPLHLGRCVAQMTSHERFTAMPDPMLATGNGIPTLRFGALIAGAMFKNGAVLANLPERLGDGNSSTLTVDEELPRLVEYASAFGLAMCLAGRDDDPIKVREYLDTVPLGDWARALFDGGLSSAAAAPRNLLQALIERALQQSHLERLAGVPSLPDDHHAAVAALADSQAEASPVPDVVALHQLTGGAVDALGRHDESFSAPEREQTSDTR